VILPGKTRQLSGGRRNVAELRTLFVVSEELPTAGGPTPGEKDLAEAVDRMLGAEVTQRDRIERRATFIVSTAGGIVTVTGALGAVLAAVNPATVPVSRLVLYFFVIAVACFLVAILIATFAIVRWGHGEGLPRNILRQVAENRVDNYQQAINEIASHQAKAADRQRALNHKRGRTVLAAAVSQMVAVACLAVAVTVLILDIAKTLP
jgi:hypothetical protein